MYNDGERIDTFTETKDSKIVKLNSANSMMGLQVAEILKTDNLWQTFLCSIPAKIKRTEVNGKSCYSISNFISPYYLVGERKMEYDIDKDTGLLVKSILDDTIAERKYEFNNVDNSVFEEPDVSQYTLQN